MTIEEPNMTDIDEARRIIAELRAEIVQLEKTLTEYELEDAENVTADGEFTVFLSPHHSEILQKLYDAQALDITFPDPVYWYTNPEFDEAWTDFIEGALDIAWDNYRVEKRDEKEERKRKRAERFFERN